MFLLSNIHDRNYARVFPDILNVRFDISDRQLANPKNAAWHDIQPGAIVCVVRSSRKLSTVYRVDEKRTTSVPDESGGYLHVIVGQVVAKLLDDVDMTHLLNKYNVTHQHLPENKFSIGFNVANLGNALAALTLQSKHGTCTLRELDSV